MVSFFTQIIDSELVEFKYLHSMLKYHGTSFNTTTQIACVICPEKLSVLD